MLFIALAFEICLGMRVKPIMMRRDGVAIEQTPNEAVRAIVAFRKGRSVPGQLWYVVYMNVYSKVSVKQVKEPRDYYQKM